MLFGYIDSRHLPISTKIQPTTKVTSCNIAKYVPETNNAPQMPHIYIYIYIFIYIYIYIYTTCANYFMYRI